MASEQAEVLDSTAVRVALWRAMHVRVDPPPHVLDDEIGLQLVAPDNGWRRRPDMDPRATRGFRAAIVARARFIEDFVAESASMSCWQPGWTPSPSADRRSLLAYGYSSSTGPVPKRGSGDA